MYGYGRGPYGTYGYGRELPLKERLLHRLKYSNFGVEAVEALFARNRYGRQFTESLIQYINKRIEIEGDYTDALRMLSRHKFPELSSAMKKVVKKCRDDKRGYNKPCQIPEPDPALLCTSLRSVQENLKNHIKSYRFKFIARLKDGVVEKLESSLAAQVKIQKKHESRVLESVQNIVKMVKMLARMKRRSRELAALVKECEKNVQTEKPCLKAAAELERAKKDLAESLQNEENTRNELKLLRKDFKPLISEAAIDIIEAEQERITTTVKIMNTYAYILDMHADQIKRSIDGMAKLCRTCDYMELSEFCRKYIYPLIEPVYERYRHLCIVENATEEHSAESSVFPGVDLLYEAGF